MEMGPCNYALQQLRHLERERHNIDIKYEQDRMKTQENCELDVQHQDITQHRSLYRTKVLRVSVSITKHLPTTIC